MNIDLDLPKWIGKLIYGLGLRKKLEWMKSGIRSDINIAPPNPKL